MISARVLLFASAALLSALTLAAQTGPFQRITSINVEENGSLISNATAGGLNLPQFSEIDLNFDGIKDLFVFDRAGNKALTFLNGGTAGQVDYTYAPQYESAFPAMKDYVLLADFDCDGKEDIFTTKSNFGVRVFRNTSSGGVLSFALAYDTLLTNNGGGKTPLLISVKDIPSFVDVDGDGDLDVLTFDGAGTHLEWHNNLQLENTGNCEGLDLVLGDACWGKFQESGTNQVIQLGVACRYSPTLPPVDPNNSRHAGSTVMAYDQDVDGDKEVIIGDLIYDGLSYLHNGGSNVTALIDSVDATWPSNNVSTRLNIFPAAYHFDADNDGKKDIVAAPNADNVSVNYNNVWLYKNVAAAAGYEPSYQTNRFLVGTMIDCGSSSMPAFFDFDQDGDQDLIVGNNSLNLSASNNKSVLTLYENTGTPQQAAFELITRNYASLSGLFSPGLVNVAPTFGDLDGDGDKDMLIGNSNGDIHLFTNTASAGQPAAFSLSQATYKGIDVGLYSTPFLIDWDRDGKLDLVIGEQTGRLKYYRNTGTTTVADFSSTPTINNFGGLDVEPVCCIGNSVPFVFQNPATLHYDLVVGADSAGLWHYPGADTATGNFVRSTRYFGGIDEGDRTAIAATDLDGDGVIDFAVGNLRGGISFYKGDYTVGVHAPVAETIDFQLYPNPSAAALSVRVKAKQSAPLQVQVCDLHGRVVAQATGKADGQPIAIDTHLLPGGVYAVACQVAGKMVGVKRWVLVR
jgi:hypothetical protein